MEEINGVASREKGNYFKLLSNESVVSHIIIDIYIKNDTKKCPI